MLLLCLFRQMSNDLRWVSRTIFWFSIIFHCHHHFYISRFLFFNFILKKEKKNILKFPLELIAHHIRMKSLESIRSHFIAMSTSLNSNFETFLLFTIHFILSRLFMEHINTFVFACLFSTSWHDHVHTWNCIVSYRIKSFFHSFQLHQQQ